MSLVTTGLFFLASLVGSVIQTVSGFGFAIFCMMAFPFLLNGYNTAVAVSGLCAASIALFMTIRYRKDVRVKVILPLLCGYLIAFPLGVQLTLVLDQATSMRSLGVVLVLLSIYFMFFDGKVRIQSNKWTGLIFGMLGGLCSGFCSIGGPPAVLYMMASVDSKEEYRASIQAYFCVGNWYGVAIRWYKGLITPEVLTGWGIALVALAIGIVIGNLIFKKININTLRKLIYLVMAFSGITMLF